MKRRKIIALQVLATALLLSLAPRLIVGVTTRRVLSFTEEGLRVRVYAPYQAYPSDTINVRVTAEALEDLDNIYITIDVFGSKSEEGKEGYWSWEDEIRVLMGVDWEEGDDKDREYAVEIPEDSDPGLIYGHIVCEWTTVDEGEDHFHVYSFTITYIMNKDYKDLQEDYGYISSEYDKLKTDYNDLSNRHTGLLVTYDSLKATYDGLKSSYDSIKSDHDTLVSEYDAQQKTLESISKYEATTGELGNYRTLTYVLAIATVIFVATTIIFAARAKVEK